MSTPPAPRPPIDHDLPCAICGYNLKGLSPDANCPECGRPVVRTFTPSLDRSDPVWLRLQASAMFPLAALALVHFTPFGDRITFDVQRPMVVLATLVAAWACWRLATPEPPGPPSDRDASLQRGLRVAAVLFAAIRIGGLAGALERQVVGIAAGSLALLALMATQILVGLHLLGLARRSGDPSLVRHARVVLWTFPLSHALDMLSPILVALLPRDNPEEPFTWVYNVFSLTHFLLAAAVYVALLLFGRLHERLRAAAVAAPAAAIASPTESPSPVLITDEPGRNPFGPAAP